MLSGKNILIGITGGIAAYKICELIRMYKRANANVRVICTPNAMNFVSKLTLQCLSQNDVGVKEFDIDNYKPEHISYADEADIMVIAPATANTIAKIANGICDNLLTSIACAFDKQIIFAPAMNTGMLKKPAIQENIRKLKNCGYIILEPKDGFLACGTEGKGRLCSLDKIFDATVSVLRNSNISRSKIVVTAGGTIEDIDPVRYISNYSSGKMGTAIADRAFTAGHDVTLITTANVERAYKVVKVKSALEMQQVLNHEFDGAEYIFMTAAVADYRVKNFAEQKIKKTDEDEITLKLVKNPDILKELCERKKTSDMPVVVGFCAETENLIENAKEKIKNKGCDFIVANDVSRKDIGFMADENEVYIINKNLEVTKIDKQSKDVVAEKILGEIYEQSRNICAHK